VRAAPPTVTFGSTPPGRPWSLAKHAPIGLECSGVESGAPAVAGQKGGKRASPRRDPVRGARNPRCAASSMELDSNSADKGTVERSGSIGLGMHKVCDSPCPSLHATPCRRRRGHVVVTNALRQDVTGHHEPDDSVHGITHLPGQIDTTQHQTTPENTRSIRFDSRRRLQDPRGGRPTGDLGALSPGIRDSARPDT